MQLQGKVNRFIFIYLIYLLECILCYLQYEVNTKLNNHRKDRNNPKAIPPCFHFRNEGLDCIQHAKLTLIEQLTETENVSKADLKLRLKQKKYSWIIK